MVFGKFPYDCNYTFILALKEEELISKIIHEQWAFPKNVVISENGYKVIQGLLEKNHKNRIDTNDPIFDLWYSEECLDIPNVKKVEFEKPSDKIKVISSGKEFIPRKSLTVSSKIAPKNFSNIRRDSKFK